MEEELGNLWSLFWWFVLVAIIIGCPADWRVPLLVIFGFPLLGGLIGIITFFMDWLVWEPEVERVSKAAQASYRPDTFGTPYYMMPLATVIKEKRDVNAFDGLIGVDEAKEAFIKALQLPMERPDLMKEYDIAPVKGILLYGPPGTGKTSLARAAAKYFGVPFVYKKTSELICSLVGSTERLIREVFKMADYEGKQNNSRCILFLDEIDSLGRQRDGNHMNRPSDIALNTILEEMDGFQQSSTVFVIAATNRRDVLDPALLRPGRLDKEIKVGLPDYKSRVELFRLYLKNVPVSNKEDFSTPEVFEAVLEECARSTEGASPADIQDICQEAKMEAASREAMAETDTEGGVTKTDLRKGVEKWLKRAEGKKYFLEQSYS